MTLLFYRDYEHEKKVSLLHSLLLASFLAKGQEEESYLKANAIRINKPGEA